MSSSCRWWAAAAELPTEPTLPPNARAHTHGPSLPPLRGCPRPAAACLPGVRPARSSASRLEVATTAPDGGAEGGGSDGTAFSSNSPFPLPSPLPPVRSGLEMRVTRGAEFKAGAPAREGPLWLERQKRQRGKGAGGGEVGGREGARREARRPREGRV